MDPLYDLADMSVPRPLQRLRHPWSAGHRRGRGPSARPRKRIGKRLMLEALEERMLLTAYLVTSTGDSNSGTGSDGTLRYVLNQLDSSGGATNTISFSLGTSQQTITPDSPLPSITKQVDIAAGTIPRSFEPLVVINGSSAGSSADGLVLGDGSSGSSIEKLVIDGFGSVGIFVDSTNDSVTGCFIGTNGTGTAAVPNAVYGIDVLESGATIGGTTASASNVLSGNGRYGVFLDAPSLVEGNEIGTDAAGLAAVPNTLDGIEAFGPGATIGGTTVGSANIISGNGIGGITFESPCLVEGNDIGIDAAGTAVPNASYGIDVEGFGATIGGTTAGSANVISGNGKDGIYDKALCLVEGNEIGTNAAGTAAVPNANYGIDVEVSGATIGATTTGSTNIISGNGYAGVYVDASCVVEGNFVGTNAAGTAAVPNSVFGIEVEEPGATIGGTVAGSLNVVSGNGNDGIRLNAPCLVEGNYVGTNGAGTAAVPNSSDGIDVEVSGATIGGTVAGSANVISGNSHQGILLDASALVEGNLIGTNAAGTAAIRSNGYGIDVASTASGATIGGTTPASTNVVSGNFSGIGVYGLCLVEGNDVGTNATGTGAVSNSIDGIDVYASGETIGGTTAGSANVISGNGSFGMVVDAPCQVEGNDIGTDRTGTFAIPNATEGIYVYQPGATIGGTTPGSGNVISGNNGSGISLFASGLVEGNNIGTNAAGNAAVPNAVYGVTVGASGATIGGTTPGSANVISGNDQFGIGAAVPTNATCLVEGNDIGTDDSGTNPVPNEAGGIFTYLYSGADLTIGAPGAGNIIAFNMGPGVATYLATPEGTIRFNSIFDNTGPGIDFNDDGVTPNTPNGANNSPVITSVSGGFITGTLNASPSSTYTIDVYANPSSDASPARPQGRTFLGSISVMTNAQGNASYKFPYAPIADEPSVTATSIDASGTNSEFSAPSGVLTASGLTINATAGVPFNGQVASFTSTDPAATASDFTATINWGDGTPSTAGTVVLAPGGFIVTGTHTYTMANPAVPVTVTITDTPYDLQATTNGLAVVSASLNVLTTYGQTANFVAGTPYTATLVSFTDSNPDAIVGQFTAAVTWGDGTIGPGTVSASGAGFVVTGTHTYNYANPDEPGMSVVITDELSGLKYTVDPTVVVAPVPLTIQPKNFAVTPGNAFSGAVATFADANPLTNPNFYTAKINWGDGTTTTGTITGANPFTISGSHTYQAAALADQGTAIVTITVTDPNGQTATAVSRAVDPPAAPSVSSTSASVASPASTVAFTMLPENITLSPSRSLHGVVATFADSGPAEPASVYKATINWGKGRRTAGMVTASNGRFVVSGRHVFPRFTGTKTVTVTVTNEADGQSASVSELVSAAAQKNRANRGAPRDRDAEKLRY
jgi:hypothetical protein